VSFESDSAFPPDGISPGLVVIVTSVVPLAGGGAMPPEGISPANVEVHSTHVKPAIIMKRFMSSPLKVGDARFLTSERIEQLLDILASQRPAD
jgi:hypothetical protein